MARVRFSRAEAIAEATRRADAFVADLGGQYPWRHISTSPATYEKRRPASKRR